MMKLMNLLIAVPLLLNCIGPATADPDFTLLRKAARRGDRDAVQAFLNEFPEGDINVPGSTALHEAAFEGHVAVVALLVTLDNINARDNDDGRTALHWAAIKGHVKVVDLLQSLGERCQINVHDIDGRTALHLAAINGHVKVVDLLLSLGERCQINVRDNDGSTALLLAAYNGEVEVVSLLLSLGERCQINTPDNHGWTALHRAAFNGRVEVVALLASLGKRCEINTLNNDGRNARHIAASNGKVEVLSLLEQLMRRDGRHREEMVMIWALTNGTPLIIRLITFKLRYHNVRFLQWASKLKFAPESIQRIVGIAIANPDLLRDLIIQTITNSDLKNGDIIIFLKELDTSTISDHLLFIPLLNRMVLLDNPSQWHEALRWALEKELDDIYMSIFEVGSIPFFVELASMAMALEHH